MKLEFFSEGPAVLVEESQRNLIVADLHFGIEADLAAHGMHFRSRSASRVKRLLRIVDDAKPDALILLGDIKHSIPTPTRQEYYEMPGIISAIREKIPIIVFPGNHDIGIEQYLKPGELQPKEGAVIDGVGYLHGHTYPSDELIGGLIVAGHHHPLLVLRDEVGCALQSPAYIRADIEAKRLSELHFVPDCPTRVLFVPAFNEIAGYDIRQIARDPFAPLSKAMIPESAEIILADGTYIGPLAMLGSDDDD